MANLKLSIVITQDLRALQDNPQVSLRVCSQALHGANFESAGSSLAESPETCAIETDQALVGPNPQVSIFGLRESRHRAAGKSAVGAPAFAHVLRDTTIWVDGMCRACKADRCQDEKCESHTPPRHHLPRHHLSIRGDTRIYRRPPHSRVAKGFWPSRLRKTTSALVPCLGSELVR
jgi:hypothetical protein